MSNNNDIPISRRIFLKVTAGIGVSFVGCVSPSSVTAPPKPLPYGGFAMGVQSYCFRKFSLNQAIDNAKQLGLNFIEIFPGHLPSNSSQEKIEDAKEKLKSAGIKVNAYGVIGFGKDHENNKRIFAFAKTMGIESLSADPSPDSFASLDRLVEEYQINIAIHNHGPGHRYASDDSVLKAIKGHHQRIGACIDTGHFIRAGVDPVQAVRKIGDRVYGIHLKDADAKGKDVIVGKGTLNLVGMFKALREVKFDGPLSLEYESEPANPLPAMEQCLVAVREALKELG